MWFRALLFTVFCPGSVAVLFPHWLFPHLAPRGGAHLAGWIPLLAGAALYAVCLWNFLMAGGTPAIFFTRPVRWLLGEEPATLVCSGIYARIRNPMYAGVLLAITGQAILFGSWAMAAYMLGVWLFFHLTAVLIEEPHLARKQGAAYAEYCRAVPRWLPYFNTRTR